MKANAIYTVILSSLILLLSNCKSSEKVIPKSAEQYVLHRKSVSKVNLETGEVTDQVFDFDLNAYASAKNEDAIFVLGFDTEEGSKLISFNFDGSVKNERVIYDLDGDNRQFGLFESEIMIVSSSRLYLVGADRTTDQLTILVHDVQTLEEVNKLTISKTYSSSLIDCIILGQHIFLSVDQQLMVLNKDTFELAKTIDFPEIKGVGKKLLRKDEKSVLFFYPAENSQIVEIDAENLEVKNNSYLSNSFSSGIKNSIDEQKGLLYAVFTFAQPAPYAIGFAELDYAEDKINYSTSFEEAKTFFGSQYAINYMKVIDDKIILLGEQSKNGQTIGVMRLTNLDRTLIQDIDLNADPIHLIE